MSASLGPIIGAAVPSPVAFGGPGPEAKPAAARQKLPQPPAEPAGSDVSMSTGALSALLRLQEALRETPSAAMSMKVMQAVALATALPPAEAPAGPG